MSEERDPIWWVASYPKSGNTWMRMLLFSYCLKANITAHATRYDDLNPYFFQSVAPKPVGDLDHFEAAALRPAALLHMREAESGPMAVKTHFPIGNMAGVPWFSPLWTHRAIYVVRDPRAVLPSLADHLGEDHAYTAQFMATDDAAVQKECGLAHLLATWSDHVRTWTNCEFPQVTVRYEDLHEDAGRELARVLEFLGIEVVDDVVESAAEEVDFGNLRQYEEAHGFSESSANQDRFFRRGETEGWREEVDPEHVAQVERDHGEMMREMGYELEAAELEVVE